MKFQKQLKQLNLNKVLTNKYVLYTIVLISFLNILGYLALNNLNAIIYFSLIGLLTYQFTKNMTIVLLVSLIVTNLLMTNKLLREGLDNMDSTNNNKDMLKGTLAEHDEEIKQAIDDIKSSSSLEEAKEKIKNNRTKINDKKNSTSSGSSTTTTETTETSEPTGISSMRNMQNNKSKEPRIDYATTLSDSYTQLQNMLGPKGMEGLTNDTKQLAEQQAQLIKQMENMMPLVQDAQKMLQGFDIKGLSNLTNMLQPSPVK